jgi:protein SCO1/2
MEKPKGKVEWLVWGAMGFTIAAIGVAFLLERRDAAHPLPVLVENLPPFALTNQAGRVVTSEALRGHVWVADIIFTRCPGPCAKMTRHMAELQAALPRRDPVRLVSLTTDPDYDQPVVLQDYARRNGAQDDRWSFLTGTKAQIAALAVGGLKFTSLEKQPELRENPNDLFIHATLFAVVDKWGRLRAVFETTGDQVNWPQVKEQIVAAVRQLLEERRE